MSITILSGGCRTVSGDGKIAKNDCNACEKQGVCAIELRSRELAELSSDLWVSTAEQLPPAMTLIMYLEYPSGQPAGTLHYGYFDGKLYKEWPSEESLPAECVIAWMIIPEAPSRLFRRRNSIYQHM